MWQSNGLVKSKECEQGMNLVRTRAVSRAGHNTIEHRVSPESAGLDSKSPRDGNDGYVNGCRLGLELRCRLEINVGAGEETQTVAYPLSRNRKRKLAASDECETKGSEEFPVITMKNTRTNRNIREW